MIFIEQVFCTSLIPTYTGNEVRKINELQKNSFEIPTIKKPSNYPVLLKGNDLLKHSDSDQNNQFNQFSNVQQCTYKYINDTLISNNNFINETKKDNFENNSNQVEVFNPNKNNNQVIASINPKSSNQLKNNDNNSQYKLEFIVKNDKYQFVKLEHVMLNNYDVSIKIIEVPTTKSSKNKGIDNCVNISKKIEIEPSLTMNIENGNITIIPDGGYTISSEISMKTMSPVSNSVMNKEFSQIISLKPNNSKKQRTGQNNFFTKSTDNVSNESNIYPSSRNHFKNQCYLQPKKCKFNEVSLSPKYINESSSTINKKRKGKILKSDKMPSKDVKKIVTTKSIQSLQKNPTTPVIKYSCSPQTNSSIKSRNLNNSSSIRFRPIPEKFLKPYSSI